MKKKMVVLLSVISIIAICVLMAGKLLSTPVGRMRLLSFYQRIIPVLYVDPKSRIIQYIENADNLFSFSHTAASRDPSLALESALRAENSMTLVVAELWKLQDTSIIPRSLLFGAFTKHYSILNSIRKNAGISAQFDIVQSFMKRNEKTAKTLYYKFLPPEVPLLN